MKKITVSDYLPESTGPYSHATISNGVCYTSGQLPINHDTGELCKDNIEVATQNCLDNIERILKTIGKSKDNIIKCNIYLKDIEDYGKMNEVYSNYFESTPPSRTAFQVGKLPFDVQIELEAIISMD